MLFTVSTDRMADRHSRVRMGMIPMSRGDPKILHGHGGQVGDDQGEDQLRGLQLPDLPLPHEADARMMRKYRMMVRMTAVITGDFPPFLHGSFP